MEINTITFLLFLLLILAVIIVWFTTKNKKIKRILKKVFSRFTTETYETTMMKKYWREIINPLKAHLIFQNRGRKDRKDEKERLVKLLSILEKEQQKLVLELLKRFTWINERKEREKRITSAFENLSPEIWKEFHIFPFFDKGRKPSRSGFDVLARIQFMKKSKKLDDFELIIQENDTSQLSKNWKIILVDDYIWTWESAITFIKEFLEKVDKQKKDNLIILTLAWQKDGIRKIEDYWVKVVTWEVFHKGISDYYNGEKQKKMIETMKSIEKIINWERNLRKEFEFWYKKSEWLISFELRCPNNTFPIFWFKETYKKWEKRPFIFIR